jgi:hypothetical protein
MSDSLFCCLIESLENAGQSNQNTSNVLSLSKSRLERHLGYRKPPDLHCLTRAAGRPRM